MSDFEAIIKDFQDINSVKAIVLSGSSTNECEDELSDLDVYIYTDKEIDITLRREISDKYALNADLNNTYWETGDEMILKDSGRTLDIMYRCPMWLEAQIENVWEKHYASIGYTTCFLHNVKSSEILYDNDGWFENLQKKINNEYPEELVQNIIKKNLPLLKEKKYASYYEQIRCAVQREDYVAVNHRIAAFLASYFDVLFAINKVFHPGEKRQIKYAKMKCAKLPANFEEDMNSLLCTPYGEKTEKLDNIIRNLSDILSYKK